MHINHQWFEASRTLIPVITYYIIGAVNTLLIFLHFHSLSIIRRGKNAACHSTEKSQSSLSPNWKFKLHVHTVTVARHWHWSLLLKSFLLTTNDYTVLQIPEEVITTQLITYINL